MSVPKVARIHGHPTQLQDARERTKATCSQRTLVADGQAPPLLNLPISFALARMAASRASALPRILRPGAGAVEVERVQPRAPARNYLGRVAHSCAVRNQVTCARGCITTEN